MKRKTQKPYLQETVITGHVPLLQGQKDTAYVSYLPSAWVSIGVGPLSPVMTIESARELTFCLIKAADQAEGKLPRLEATVLEAFKGNAE